MRRYWNAALGMGIRTRTVALLAVTALVLWIALFSAGLVLGGRTADAIDRHRVTAALSGAKAAVDDDCGDLARSRATGRSGTIRTVS